MNGRRKFGVKALILAMALLATVPAAAEMNVFVMVSDGASFGAWDAADLYTSGTTASSSYYQAPFKKYLMTTFPLNMSSSPTGNPTPLVSYDPVQAWDSTTAPGTILGTNGYLYPQGFAGYNYLRQNATDSAAAATAMATGQKTYNNAINWSNNNVSLTPTLPELAKQYGMTVGAITSVQWSHATPAGFSDAHNISRGNYAAIANEMLSGSAMDVIMGAGNPQFNDNGIKTVADYKIVTDSQAKYVGGKSTWINLVEGTAGWQLVQSKSDFENLANGNLPGNIKDLKLVGTAEAGSTLQQGRTGWNPNNPVVIDESNYNQNVPTLLTMTKAAVNVLDAKSDATGNKGFFLMVEGGAVDWAAHANQGNRLIEEQVDFNKSVDWVVNWIGNNGGWEKNLLIITTDHANSMPSGNDVNTFMDRLTVNDVNGVPSIVFYSNEHMNQLVPLFAAGACAGEFDDLIDGTDNFFGQYFPDWMAAGFNGSYLDNTDIFTVASGCMALAAPIPGSFLLLGSGLGGLLIIGLRRRNA